mgnify:CR=1 FL=1
MAAVCGGEADNTPICGGVNIKVDNRSVVRHHAPMKVADALRNARVSAGLTQRQIAEMLGVTPQFICDIELERRVLGEKYLPLLPPGIRVLVTWAMVNEHRSTIARLENGAIEPQPPEAA